MPREIPERRVGKRLAGVGAAQHQTAAAHVAAADELLRKKQAVAQDGKNRAEILLCRHAAEQDEIAFRTGSFMEAADAALERDPVTRLFLVDRNRRQIA